MADLWYIQDAGRELGPMGSMVLRIMAEEGKITRHTLVRPEGGTWIPAGQVNGLFADLPAPSNAPRDANPQAGRARAASSAPSNSTPSTLDSGSGGETPRWAVSLVLIVVFIGIRVMFSAFSTSSRSPSPPAFDPQTTRLMDDLRKAQERPLFVPEAPEPAFPGGPRDGLDRLLDEMLRDPDLDPEVRRTLERQREEMRKGRGKFGEPGQPGEP